MRIYFGIFVLMGMIEGSVLHAHSKSNEGFSPAAPALSTMQEVEASSFIVKKTDAGRSSVKDSKNNLKKQMADCAREAVHASNAVGLSLARWQQSFLARLPTESDKFPQQSLVRSAMQAFGKTQELIFQLQKRLTSLLEALIEGHSTFNRAHKAHLAESLCVVKSASEKLESLKKTVTPEAVEKSSAQGSLKIVENDVQKVGEDLSCLGKQFDHDKCLKNIKSA